MTLLFVRDYSHGGTEYTAYAMSLLSVISVPL
jgi:hypothetical protein